MRIENTVAEPVEGLKVFLYVVAEPYDWKKESTAEVFKAQKIENLKIQGYDKLDVAFDSVTLQPSLSKQGSTRWKGGHEMTGYLVEVRYKGEILFTDSKGGSKVREAVKFHGPPKDPKK